MPYFRDSNRKNSLVQTDRRDFVIESEMSRKSFSRFLTLQWSFRIDSNAKMILQERNQFRRRYESESKERETKPAAICFLFFQRGLQLFECDQATFDKKSSEKLFAVFLGQHIWQVVSVIPEARPTSPASDLPSILKPLPLRR